MDLWVFPTIWLQAESYRRRRNTQDWGGGGDRDTNLELPSFLPASPRAAFSLSALPLVPGIRPCMD